MGVIHLDSIARGAHLTLRVPVGRTSTVRDRMSVLDVCTPFITYVINQSGLGIKESEDKLRKVNSKNNLFPTSLMAWHSGKLNHCSTKNYSRYIIMSSSIRKKMTDGIHCRPVLGFGSPTVGHEVP